jgi:hypothetical protein
VVTTDCTGATIEVKGAAGVDWAKTGVETTGLTGNVDIVGGLTTEPTTLWTGATVLIGTDAIGWVLTTVWVGIVLADAIEYMGLCWVIDLVDNVVYTGLGGTSNPDPRDTAV